MKSEPEQSCRSQLQKQGTKRKDGAHIVEEIKDPENKRLKEEDPRDLFF